MAQEKMTRAWIEMAVGNAIRDIDTDPERTLRKLVDLTLGATSGAFQKTFLTVTQKLLEDEGSAYYRLMQRTVRDVDHVHLQTFSLNVGLNGCVDGAEKIRENEAKLGINIPWAFCLDAQADGASPALLSSLAAQGKALGSYVYMVFGSAAAHADWANVYREHSDGAFVLFVRAEDVTPDNAASLASLQNVLISIMSASQGALLEAATLLHTHKALYAVHKLFDDQSWQEASSDETLSAIEPLHGTFFVLLPQPGTNKATREAVRQRVVQVRKAQQHAFFIMNLESDLLEIDKAISGDACTVSFLGPNRLLVRDALWEGNAYDLRLHPLAGLLGKVTAK